MRRSTLVVIAMLVGAVAARAQEPSHTNPLPPNGPPASPITAVGVVPGAMGDLTPGDKLPDFHLDSSLGGTLSRKEFLGHWSVLVFSASRNGFANLGAVDDSLRASGARAFGVSQDGLGALRGFAQREGLAFPLLSDPTGAVSAIFGMFDVETNAIQSGLLVLDEKGVVRMVVQSPTLHPDEVLAMARHTIAAR